MSEVSRSPSLRSARTMQGFSAKAVQSRQAFEDALCEGKPDKRMQVLDKVHAVETKLDAFCGALIILNLVVLGLETDLNEKVADGKKYTDATNLFASAEQFCTANFIFRRDVLKGKLQKDYEFVRKIFTKIQ